MEDGGRESRKDQRWSVATEKDTDYSEHGTL
jgi:hypothetical protein